MSNVADAIARVRRELGDFGQPFTDTLVGLGTDNGRWDLSETNISGATVLHLSGGVTTTLTEGTDYDLDTVDGTLYLKGALNPLPENDTIILSGKTYGMFSDDELAEYVNDAVIQHTAGRNVRTRVRDQSGFIRYTERSQTVDDLGPEEVFLVSLLATIECLWALTTDASTDIDIHTPDGTSVGRSVRYAQMRNQIDVLTDKYQDLAAQLNVGLHRIETLQVRRKSRATGRLVPLWESREYDDWSTPRRILPPIDDRYADESDVPSSLNPGVGW